MTLYAVAHVIARILFGETWFERGDGFEVYSSMVARASPLGRRAEGQLVLRNPLDGLGPDHPDTLITRNHLACWTDVARPSG